MKKKELKNQIKILEEEVAKLRAEVKQLTMALHNQESNIIIIKEKCPDTSGNVAFPTIPYYQTRYWDPPFVSASDDYDWI